MGACLSKEKENIMEKKNVKKVNLELEILELESKLAPGDLLTDPQNGPGTQAPGEGAEC